MLSVYATVVLANLAASIPAPAPAPNPSPALNPAAKPALRPVPVLLNISYAHVRVCVYCVRMCRV